MGLGALTLISYVAFYYYNFDTTLLTIPDLAGDLEEDQQQGWQE